MLTLVKGFFSIESYKIGFFIVPIFSICIKFLDLLFFDLFNKFTTVLLALLLSPLTILLLLALNAFGANFSYNWVIFDIEISSIAILLKLYIKH